MPKGKSLPTKFTNLVDDELLDMLAVFVTISLIFSFERQLTLVTGIGPLIGVNLRVLLDMAGTNKLGMTNFTLILFRVLIIMCLFMGGQVS